jgi:hypothetical protein
MIGELDANFRREITMWHVLVVVMVRCDWRCTPAVNNAGVPARRWSNPSMDADPTYLFLTETVRHPCRQNVADA